MLLTAKHLPIALWLAVGVAYAGGDWGTGGRRMDFVRFSGELFICYALIAFGGGVLVAFTITVFNAIGLDVEWRVEAWMLPCGASGAVIVGAWLVEAKQSVIENMAPVLTRLFTPLFTSVLLALLATMAWRGSSIDVEREVLIGFDLLLVLVLGLLLYARFLGRRGAFADLERWQTTYLPVYSVWGEPSSSSSRRCSATSEAEGHVLMPIRL